MKVNSVCFFIHSKSFDPLPLLFLTKIKKREKIITNSIFNLIIIIMVNS